MASSTASINLGDIFAINAESQRLERERCAALVEAQGCICNYYPGPPAGAWVGGALHWSACPVALAAAIREGA